MTHINIRSFGIAFGFTGAMLYAGCALIMLLMGRDAITASLNTLIHGLDVSSLVRMNFSVVDLLIGIVQTFVLSWLIGACIAAFYNMTLKAK